MSSLHYGLSSRAQLHEHIRHACQVLSPNNTPQAIQLMIGTACAETHFGTFRDDYEPQGRGVYQFDGVRFNDIRDYLIVQRKDIHKIIIEEFGFDMRYIGFNSALDHSPLLNSVLCRIGYYMKPEPLPYVGDVIGQAAYYKKHWNSSIGKSSPEKYIEALAHGYTS
jgi:hypothetical protein